MSIHPHRTPILNRYTSLPVLLDILLNKHLVLLSPEEWEDKNDSHYLERYKEDKKLKTLVALCFSKKHETFHHWKVFSSGSSGVCIEFDRDSLLNPIKDLTGFRVGDVEYRWIKEVKRPRPPLQQWPFLKRKPFEDEDEFRIVYEDATTERPTNVMEIHVSWIRKITLSPWMPKPVANSVKQVVALINGCGGLTINRSELLETAGWKAAIKKIPQ
jgi:hypothetical protein